MRTVPVAQLYDRQFRTIVGTKHLVRKLHVVLNELQELESDGISDIPQRNPDTSFGFEIIMGDAPNQRSLNWQLKPLLKRNQPLDQPHFIDPRCTVLFFADTLFVCDAPPANVEERTVAMLSAKRHVLARGASVAKLKSEVAALEALTAPQEKTGRPGIPSDVKRAVWVRDGGACRQCGAKKELHFDHIIPYSKGGADSIENLQILCGPCNRSKSDRV